MANVGIGEVSFGKQRTEHALMSHVNPDRQVVIVRILCYLLLVRGSDFSGCIPLSSWYSMLMIKYHFPVRTMYL